MLYIWLFIVNFLIHITYKNKLSIMFFFFKISENRNFGIKIEGKMYPLFILLFNIEKFNKQYKNYILCVILKEQHGDIIFIHVRNKCIFPN